jgi:D-lyxose ketol-isomerase
MKRSEINELIRDAEDFIADQGFHLPPFAFWTPADWREKSGEAEEIRRKSLGWDLTDFGLGDYTNKGLILFTIRNGDVNDPDETQNYAEKIMIVNENQVTPWHFHWHKTEDIINRGSGRLVIELAWASPDESALDDRQVRVSMDGVLRTVESSGSVTLDPGESITIPPGLYHSFYAEPGMGRVLVGEVSGANDDKKDNRFLDPVSRFPDIEEDEEPQRLLCNEYPPADRKEHRQ